LKARYDDLTKEELIRSLEAREQRERFGLVWEANEIERDKALNNDFVALDLDEKLSCGAALGARATSRPQQPRRRPHQPGRHHRPPPALQLRFPRVKGLQN
jgi:hypothetical protein